MAKLVLLLSLLSAIIGWSEAKDVCRFSLVQGVLWPELKTEKKQEEGKVWVEEGEVFVGFEDVFLSPRLEIHFECLRETRSRIMNHEHTVEFDLYLSDDGIRYASVKYLKDLIPGTKYLFTQSGTDGDFVYDVSGLSNSGHGYYTIIIPSNLLSGEIVGNPGEKKGYAFSKASEVLMDFDGLNSKTITGYELRFQHKRIKRAHTTVALMHDVSGTLVVFPVTSLDKTTTVLTSNKRDFSWVMVLSEPDLDLDGKVFESSRAHRYIFRLKKDKKVTYDLPSPPPVVTSGSHRRQSSGKNRR